MNKALIKKNIRLINEFDKLMFKDERIMSQVPYGATLFMTVKGDEEFNKASLEIARKVSGKKAKLVEAHKEGKRWVVRPVN
jgi:hypothetical protein